MRATLLDTNRNITAMTAAGIKAIYMILSSSDRDSSDLEASWVCAEGSADVEESILQS